MAGSMFGQREDLLAKDAALKGALATTRKQIRAIQKKEHKAKQKRESQWRLSEFLKRVALILFATANHDPAAAATFLARQAAKQKWEPKPDGEVRGMVEELFMAIELEEFTNLCDVANSTAPDCMRAAMAFWQEWSVNGWVEGANLQQGVAPSTAAMLDQLERHRLALPQAVRPPARGVAAQGKARAWAARYRQRWGLQHGRIPARDTMPLQETRAKARNIQKTEQSPP